MLHLLLFLMNAVSKLLFRKSVLLFFDDKLIYKTLSDHVRTVFDLMKQHHLHAKMSKCVLGVNMVEYLGHYINAEGVSTESKKIEVQQ